MLGQFVWLCIVLLVGYLTTGIIFSAYRLHGWRLFLWPVLFIVVWAKLLLDD